jgi:ABC-type multidrug transport system fused ATPase/permease subunit
MLQLFSQLFSQGQPEPRLLPEWWVSYLLRSEGKLFLLSALCKLLWSASALSCAYYFVQNLVATRDIKIGLSLCFAYLAAMIALSFFAQCLGFLSGQLGSRVKARLAALVAEHALLHAAASKTNQSLALTLASSEAHLVCDGAAMFHYLWAAPVEAVAIIALLVDFSNYGGWICAAVASASILTLYALSVVMTRIRARFNAARSQQVVLFFEVLQNVRSFRFYGWDAFFLRKLHGLTGQMESLLAQLGMLKSFNYVLTSALSPLLCIVMFGFLSKQMGTLTAELAFTALSLFNTLRFPMVMLPNAARSYSSASAAYNRIRDFLNSDKVVDHRHVLQTAGVVEIHSLPVGPSGAMLDKWAASPGELWIFQGPVRSYKTTLIETIAGHCFIAPSASVGVGGRVSYAMQRPWLRQATIRDNIVCCEPWNAERYDRVLFACALKTDLSVMQLGDETPIAEKGISLSGGQRQRVGLARAAYRIADVYLLDNPVSALDDQTQQHIWTHLIEGLLQSSTVIVASSRPVPSCTAVLKLSRDGVLKGDSAVTRFNGFMNENASAGPPLRYSKPFSLEATSCSAPSSWTQESSEGHSETLMLPVRSRSLTMEDAAVANMSREVRVYRRYTDDIERAAASSGASAFSSVMNFFNDSAALSRLRNTLDEELLTASSSSNKNRPNDLRSEVPSSFFDYYERLEKSSDPVCLDRPQNADSSLRLGEFGRCRRQSESTSRADFKGCGEVCEAAHHQQHASNVTENTKATRSPKNGLLGWIEEGNIWMWIPVAISYPLSQGIRITSDFFLRFWSENRYDHLSQQGYLEVYSWMTCG